MVRGHPNSLTAWALLSGRCGERVQRRCQEWGSRPDGREVTVFAACGRESVCRFAGAGGACCGRCHGSCAVCRAVN